MGMGRGIDVLSPGRWMGLSLGVIISPRKKGVWGVWEKGGGLRVGFWGGGDPCMRGMPTSAAALHQNGHIQHHYAGKR